MPTSHPHKLNPTADASTYATIPRPAVLMPSMGQFTLSAPVPGVEWKAAAVHIEDAPRFTWRGAHLDAGRHFMPKEASPTIPQ